MKTPFNSAAAAIASFLMLFQVTHGIELRDPRAFFQQCRRIHDYHFSNELRAPVVQAQRPSNFVGTRCTTYRCFAQQAASSRDLRHLENLRCTTNTDCMSESTGMVCRKFEGYNDRILSLCDCPMGQAYNPVACKCQDAEPCADSAFCRNGMKCTEEYCRCNSFQGHLIDPHSQKCVQVRTSEKEFSSQSSGGGGSSAYTTAVVFLCLISVVVAVLAIMMAAQGCQGMCDRGQYVCDEVKDPGNRSDRSGNGATPHVAAWDLPGLDYLSEEQTMKYLNRGRPSPPVDTSTPNNQPLRRIGGTHQLDQVDRAGGSPGSSPSPSASGEASLPESDRFEPAHDVVSRRPQDNRGQMNAVSKANSVETVQSHIL